MNNELKQTKYHSAVMVGGGAFGTSIASVLSNNFRQVIIKVRSKEVYHSINDKHENSIYLPAMKLSQNIVAALTWDEVETLTNDCAVELLVSGIPTAAISDVFTRDKSIIEDYLKQGVNFVSLSKGIDHETLELANDLLFDIFPNYRESFTFLSGPSFANEIMKEEITMVTIAGKTRQRLVDVSHMFETSYFKAWASYDIRGVLLGGALKNILAIAGGIIEGLGMTYNSRAAMITRGIAEINQFGVVFNARPETLYGLSGMGDLILTTTGSLSRNKQFGLEIAKRDRTPIEIIKAQRSVVEGYKTTEAAYLIAKKYKIKTSIISGTYDVLYKDADPLEVIKSLMSASFMFE